MSFKPVGKSPDKVKSGYIVQTKNGQIALVISPLTSGGLVDQFLILPVRAYTHDRVIKQDDDHLILPLELTRNTTSLGTTKMQYVAQFPLEIKQVKDLLQEGVDEEKISVLGNLCGTNFFDDTMNNITAKSNRRELHLPGMAQKPSRQPYTRHTPTHVTARRKPSSTVVLKHDITLGDATRIGLLDPVVAKILEPHGSASEPVRLRTVLAISSDESRVSETN